MCYTAREGSGADRMNKPTPITLNPYDSAGAKADKLNMMLGYIYGKLNEQKAGSDTDISLLQKQVTTLMQNHVALKTQVSAIKPSPTPTPEPEPASAFTFLTRDVPEITNSTVDIGTYMGFPPLVIGLECEIAGYQCSQVYDLTGITNDTGGAWQKAVPSKTSESVDTFILEVKRNSTTYSLRIRLLK